MNHIHNETVLGFLKAHKGNPNVMKFIRNQNKGIKKLNKELSEDYKDFFDYLESNIGDDASLTTDYLKGLIKPFFEVNLNLKEQKEYDYGGFIIMLDALKPPLHIKDKGHFFSIWDKFGTRMDIPLRFLKRFLKFLDENKVKYESELK